MVTIDKSIWDIVDMVLVLVKLDPTRLTVKWEQEHINSPMNSLCDSINILDYSVAF